MARQPIELEQRHPGAHRLSAMAVTAASSAHPCVGRPLASSAK
jgi:hypothetical protein